MMKLLRKFGREDGAEIAEAAVVLPLVFMFLLGIVWFGRAFNIYSTITQAAQRGAQTAARPTCATCGNAFDNTSVTAAVYSVIDASSLDRTLIIPHAPSIPATDCPAPAPVHTCSPNGSQISICRSVLLNDSTNPKQCGVVVSFQYPFQFVLPFTSLSMQQITLTAEAQSRVEN
jgi:Flp pilus assembly protein TadG